jgi:hypothetical protein
MALSWTGTHPLERLDGHFCHELLVEDGLPGADLVTHTFIAHARASCIPRSGTAHSPCTYMTLSSPGALRAIVGSGLYLLTRLLDLSSSRMKVGVTPQEKKPR